MIKATNCKITFYWHLSWQWWWQWWKWWWKYKHLKGRFLGCLSVFMHLVRKNLQTRISILRLVRTNLQTRDLQSIYILYFTLCCSNWISTKQCNFYLSCLTLLLKAPSSSLIQSNFKSSFQAKATFTFIWSSPTPRNISPALHPHRPGWPHQSRWHLKFSQCIHLHKPPKLIGPRCAIGKTRSKVANFLLIIIAKYAL